ncbi:2-C-methyl-D-erythritol 4-phosphate cytidylyltransferase [Dysgonomonas sp. 216]|uniref:2-C-methyl-D-erythritol 4-phosphate cytidylyltransferase n=1 Tax=Dysgonomonas sp. 216 TaxID=2302934 RepID=UPI0013D807CA|nr:2-C-methyl-D-erythritol 4-phosphate cytidylyltransferase [Dysgonomonas sp. 216]NDW18399.1 2-C-methyl-D-erythritol 4-phosphate cytidylyltransferase [Dysgonomonas sp. 216]
MSSQKNNIIIVAGGKGLRMGHELPKQFLEIGGKPVLMHTIEAFYKYDQQINIIVVLSANYMDYWKEICEKYSFTIEHSIVEGGETRFHSVKSGLSLVQKGLVGVHDAARPLVSPALIKRIFEAAAVHKAVIPVVDCADSLREMIDSTRSRVIDRSKIRMVQTPQVFDSELLRKVYNLRYIGTFTDDASVVESYGHEITLVKGETTNIKITTPFDLEIAEVILKTKK